VALAKLNAVDGSTGAPTRSIERLRWRFEHQLRDLSADGDRDHAERHAAARRLHMSVVNAQREEAVRLRDHGEISDDVLYRVLRSLDLEEEQLDAED
jgi:CPA1 family monovalent cation:H+ antiporter